MWQDHPQPPLVTCYDKPKGGSANLGNLFTKEKSPPTRNRPISPKPIATNKVRGFGGQSAPPSLKEANQSKLCSAHLVSGGSPLKLRSKGLRQEVAIAIEVWYSTDKSPFGTQLLVGCFYGTGGVSSGARKGPLFRRLFAFLSFGIRKDV